MYICVCVCVCVLKSQKPTIQLHSFEHIFYNGAFTTRREWSPQNCEVMNWHETLRYAMNIISFQENI